MDEINTKAKYCQNPNYTCIFKFLVSGIINKTDIMGTLYKKTNVLGEKYSIDFLNHHKKLGNIDIQIESSVDNETKGILKIPLKAEETTVCLVCALVENINKIGAYKSFFKFIDFEFEGLNNSIKIITRAKNIYETKIIKYVEDLDSTINNLFIANLKKINIIEKLPNIFCSDKFEKNTEIYLVEGRADVLNLSKVGIQNVISVNGLNTPPEFYALVTGKKCTAMFDSDRGGQTILFNLCQKIEIQFIIKLPENTKVEELPQTKIIELINENKQIFNKENYITQFKIKYHEKN